MYKSPKQIDNEKNERISELEKALRVCYKSLCTYGKHPVIDNQVNKVI